MSLFQISFHDVVGKLTSKGAHIIYKEFFIGRRLLRVTFDVICYLLKLLKIYRIGIFFPWKTDRLEESVHARFHIVSYLDKHHKLVRRKRFRNFMLIIDN